ncbi:MAG: hypothetical protein AB1696_00430 [Planctomycetota bacterium]
MCGKNGLHWITAGLVVGLFAMTVAVGQPSVGTSGATALPKVEAGKMALDGDAKDWTGLKPLWEEAGAKGGGMWKQTIDFKQVYVAHDGKRLWILACSSPSPDEQYRTHERSGLFELYFDMDANRDTGYQAAGPFDIAAARGAELAVGMAARPKGGSYQDGCRIIMALHGLNSRGKFGSDAQASPRQDSDEAGSWIAHGPDGVEMAIPLKDLNVKDGQPFRILFGEKNQGLDSSKAVFSEAVVVVKD